MKAMLSRFLVIMIHQLLNSKWSTSPSKVDIGDPAVGSDGRCGEGHRRRELDREGRICWKDVLPCLRAIVYAWRS